MFNNCSKNINAHNWNDGNLVAVEQKVVGLTSCNVVKESYLCQQDMTIPAICSGNHTSVDLPTANL